MNVVSQKRPRPIRVVTKWTGKKGKEVPKVARDRRTQHTAERIKAMQPRPCASVDCPWPNLYGHSRHGIIGAGTSYIRIATGDSRRIGQRFAPITADYHPDCVPEEDRPLVRILIGYRWIAETCTSGDRPTSTRKFTSVDAWTAWVDKKYPSFRKTFEVHDNNGSQVGTGYGWSRVSRYHGHCS